jgi:hypothetical protein
MIIPCCSLVESDVGLDLFVKILGGVLYMEIGLLVGDIRGHGDLLVAGGWRTK